MHLVRNALVQLSDHLVRGLVHTLYGPRRFPRCSPAFPWEIRSFNTCRFCDCSTPSLGVSTALKISFSCSVIFITGTFLYAKATSTMYNGKKIKSSSVIILFWSQHYKKVGRHSTTVVLRNVWSYLWFHSFLLCCFILSWAFLSAHCIREISDELFVPQLFTVPLIFELDFSFRTFFIRYLIFIRLFRC